jgi:hypothetical protein
VKRSEKWWLILLALLGLQFACGKPMSASRDGGGSVQIELKNVRVRQYNLDRLTFEFSAPRLVVEEEMEVVRAPDGARGKFEESSWEEREK